MNELEEIRAELERPGARVTVQHLLKVVMLLERWQDVGARTNRSVDARLAPLEGRLLVVDELPVNAPMGALIRVKTDLAGTLYLGNGPTRPLSKLLPVAVT